MKKQYYYSVAVNGDEYTLTPSHNFIPLRLLRNQAYWKKPFEGVVDKQKTLVIHAPEAQHWNDEQCFVVRERLKQMQKNGFSIYIYQQKKLIIFNAKTVYESSTLFGTELISDQNMMKTISQQLELSSDEILILNYEELIELCEGDEDWSELKSYQTVDLQGSSLTLASLSRLIDKAGFEIQTLNLTNCFNLQGKCPDDLALKVPNLQHLILGNNTETPVLKYPDQQIFKSMLQKSHEQGFLSQLISASQKLKTLNLNYCQYLPSTLVINAHYLETLNLSGKNPNLAAILSEAKHLKSLTLADCSSLDETIPDDLQLSSLETLTLDGSNVNWSSLGNLLSRATNIKKLHLNECENLDDDFSWSFHLNSLVELKLNGSTINCSSLSKLLLNATNIKTLTLSECSNLLNDIPDVLNLSSLENLDVSGSFINGRALGKLLSNATSLKALDLSECEYLSDEIPDALNLSFIETLELRYSNINRNSLDKLLANNTNLKTLDLSFCYILNDNLLDMLINPSSLEVLAINTTKINNASLEKLLSNATGLKTLSLFKYNNPDNIFSETPHLKSLETFELNDSNLSCVSLGKLLSNTTHIKTLGFYDYCNQDDTFPEDPNLKYLETFELNNSSINSIALIQLLSKATNLRHLTLTCNETLDESILDSFDTSSVESLKLMGSHMKSSSFLKKLLTKTINLLILDLTLCTDLSEDDLGEICLIYPSLDLKTANHFSSPQYSNPIKYKDVERNNNRVSLDADTKQQEGVEFNINQLFWSLNPSVMPDVSLYRSQLFNRIEIESHYCAIEQAFTLTNNDNNLRLTPVQLTRAKQDVFPTDNPCPINSYLEYYGKKTLILDNQWQALPSLSPHEIMTRYHLSHDVNVEIQYSERDNLYYIRNQNYTPFPMTISIDFIIFVPQQEITPPLPKHILKLIEHCRSFSAAPLQLNQTKLTGKDYLNALITQKVGACRHRSLVFKVLMDGLYPNIPVRIINNDCHSFIELFCDYRWITCNLGGYPAKLTIESANQPNQPPIIQRIYFTQQTIPRAQFNTPETYVQELLATKQMNTLLQLNDTESIAGLRHQLQLYCLNTQRPCYYAHSPEDLICSAPYLACQQNDETLTGVTKIGPGGALYDFLIQHAQDGSEPMLIINYDRFTAKEIVQFNGLLDDERKADGTAIPEKTQIIGLINPDKPSAYNGDDFYSRFNDRQRVPFNKTALTLAPIATHAPEPPHEAYVIDLFGDQCWEEQLLGRWVLHQQSLSFVNGALIEALNNGHTQLHLKNPPRDNDAFDRFWQDAFLYKKIDYHGQTKAFPSNMRLTQSEGYSFNTYREQISINPEENIPHGASLLNPGVLSHYYSEYVYNAEQKTISQNPGIIESNHGKTLHLYVSQNLPLSAWAYFLETCHQQQVKVHLTLAPEVNLPESIGIKTDKIAFPPIKAWPTEEITPTTLFINSNDCDATIDGMENVMVIDVSELEPTDLLTKLDGTFDHSTRSFKFNEQEGVLLRALKDNKNIILKGHFQNALRDALNEFLLRRQQQPKTSGRLLLISNQENLFPLIPSYQHEVSIEYLKTILTSKFKSISWMPSDALIEHHSLTKLIAMGHYLQINPDNPVTSPWQGLEKLPPFVAYKQDSIWFNSLRLKAVHEILDYSPFVFLAGMTGVGKTSFVQNTWKKECSALHIGEENINAWAYDQTPGLKTLFIDEANISSRQWSQFEGLFNHPPSILIGNEYVQLTPEHKVIFAGNPISYGGERQLPALFERHGGSIIFEPMPSSYIAHHILNPIVEKFDIKQQDLQLICKPILDVSDFLSNCSVNAVLISPRELSMMLLLTINCCHNYPDLDASKVAQYYAYTLAIRFVPEDRVTEFEQLFKIDAWPRSSNALVLKNIVINDSNRPALNTISDFLSLRSHRQNGLFINDSQRLGGLGGIILEGDPGLGKSTLVKETLIAHGLCQGRIDGDHRHENVFYMLPTTMQYSDKENLLLKAFHEGAVVIIDEINSMSMERLLNSLLMGKTPQGESPRKPGFMIIGTQNPMTMAGRTRPSSALMHRMHTIELPEYSRQEMVEILVQKQLPQIVSEAMVNEYICLREHASQNRTVPLDSLCFRDLLKKAALVAQNHLAVHEPTFNDLDVVTLMDITEDSHDEIEREDLYFGDNIDQFDAQRRLSADLQLPDNPNKDELLSIDNRKPNQHVDSSYLMMSSHMPATKRKESTAAPKKTYNAPYQFKKTTYSAD